MKTSHRHGDVALIRIEGEEAASVKKALGDTPYQKELTLALGEATGHHHTMYPSTNKAGVRLIEIDGRRFLDVGITYFLRHQEHKEQRIEPGLYRIPMESEYDPFEKAMRKVVD